MGGELSKNDSECSTSTTTLSTPCEPNKDFGYGIVKNVLERSPEISVSNTEEFSPGTLRRLVSTTSYIHESSVF